VTGFPKSRPLNVAEAVPVTLPVPSKMILPRLAVDFGVPEMVVDPDNWNA
jgi:hypothetical protein